MIVLNMQSTISPFEQIRSQIAAQIQSGALRPGHRLPSIRQLAKDLRVAPGTVARAYSELEGAGLIETDRKRGSIVRASSSTSRMGELSGAIERVVDLAREAGVGQADVVGMLTNAWSANVHGRDPNVTGRVHRVPPVGEQRNDGLTGEENE